MDNTVELLHTIPTVIKVSVPNANTSGVVMDVRKDDGTKLFNINESGDTNIAGDTSISGNLKFDGDMDLDPSATETLTQPYNNPVISVADGELVNFYTNELIAGQYQHMDMDSHGNIYVSVQRNKTSQYVDKVYKITQTGEFSEFYSSPHHIWCIHFDKNDTMYLTGHNSDRIQKIETSGRN